jgi:hypothetical protein
MSQKAVNKAILVATFFLLDSSRAYSSTLKVKVVRSSETSVNFNCIIWRHIPEDSTFRGFFIARFCVLKLPVQFIYQVISEIWKFLRRVLKFSTWDLFCSLWVSGVSISCEIWDSVLCVNWFIRHLTTLEWQDEGLWTGFIWLRIETSGWLLWGR